MSKIRVDQVETLDATKTVSVSDIVDGSSITSSTGNQTIDEALGSRVSHIDSVSEFQSLDSSFLADSQQVSVKEYESWSGSGGGIYYWDEDLGKTNHDGGTVISPTVPWDGLEAGHQDFLNGVGESDGAGSGCWVLKDEPSITSFGAYKSLSKDQGYVLQAFNTYADSVGKEDLLLPNNFELFLASKESVSFSVIKSNRATVKGRIDLTNGNKVEVSGIDFTLDAGWTAKEDTWAIQDITDGFLKVHNCSFDGSWISKEFGGTGLSDGLSVVNCDFLGVSNSDIANAVEVAQSEETVITNSRFPGLYYRHVKLSSVPSVNTDANLVVRITNNTFNGSVHSEKQIIDAYTDARLFMVSDNHFNPTNRIENFVGYKSEGTAGNAPFHDKVIISNNICVGEVSDYGFFFGGGYGLTENYTEQALAFSNNTVEITNSDIANMAVRTTFIHHVNISGNTILTADIAKEAIRVSSSRTAAVTGNPLVMGRVQFGSLSRTDPTPTDSITISSNQTEVDSSTSYPINIQSVDSSGSTSTFNISNNSVHMLAGTREEFRISGSDARALTITGNNVRGSGYAVSLASSSISRFSEFSNSWQPQDLSVSSAPEGVGQIRVNSGNAYIATGTSSSADWKRIDNV